jgi:uncharacterized protein (UPF0332 family)
MAAGMPEVAAREAHMAAFHAAQACLFERDGRAPKTHSGVHAAFGLLAAGEAGLGRRLGRRLGSFLAAVEAFLGAPPGADPA